MPEVTDAILDRLKLQREKLNARIQKREARYKEQERKADTRRKIIIGGICQKLLAEHNALSISKADLMNMIRASLKPKDFTRLFEEDPLETMQPNAETLAAMNEITEGRGQAAHSVEEMFAKLEKDDD